MLVSTNLQLCGQSPAWAILGDAQAGRLAWMRPGAAWAIVGGRLESPAPTAKSTAHDHPRLDAASLGGRVGDAWVMLGRSAISAAQRENGALGDRGRSKTRSSPYTELLLYIYTVVFLAAIDLENHYPQPPNRGKTAPPASPTPLPKHRPSTTHALLHLVTNFPLDSCQRISYSTTHALA